MAESAGEKRDLRRTCSGTGGFHDGTMFSLLVCVNFDVVLGLGGSGGGSRSTGTLAGGGGHRGAVTRRALQRLPRGRIYYEEARALSGAAEEKF